MADRYFLSESDRKAVQDLLDDARSRRQNTTGRPGRGEVDHEEIFLPEVYVVKTPTDGIPALTTSIKDYPGYADCFIYRVLDIETSLPYLEQMDEFSRRVHNLTIESIPGDTWCLALRDKFGGWFASTGGGTANTRLVQLTATCFYDGSDARDIDGICPDPYSTGLTCAPEIDCQQRFPLFSWRRVLDTDDPILITYVDGVNAGSPQCFPVIHVQGIPLPTHPPPSPIAGTPNAASSNSSAGQSAWDNPTNAETSDDSYAACTMDIAETSEYLVLTGFCFGLHANTTISSISVIVEAHADDDSVEDIEVKLVVDGSITGTSRHTGTELTTTDADYTFSGTPTQWGVPTLSVLQINKSTFGCALRYANAIAGTGTGSGTGTGTSSDRRTASIDAVEMQIAFTPSGTLNVPHATVRVWKGAGDYWLTDTPVFRGLFRRTGNVTADGRECYLRYWDANAQEWRDGKLYYEVLAE